MLEKNTYQNISAYSDYPIHFINNSDIYTFPTHWHNYVEIIHADQNNVCYEINQHNHTLSQNDFLFIWPGELHSLVHQPQPSHVQILQFDYSLLAQRPDFQKINFLFHSLRQISFSQNQEISQELSILMNQIECLFFSNDTFFEVKCCMTIYQFFILVGEYLFSSSSCYSKQPETLHSSQVTERMISICSYLSSHCTEQISLSEAADIAGFSKYHFSRIFKDFTNSSFTDFITKERLRNAEELLHNSNLSITDIALQSGFGSISTFNRVFLEFKHCSPTTFRRISCLTIEQHSHTS